MIAVEEAIIRILGKTELESPGVDQQILRGILQEVLYEYSIQPQCTDLVLVNDMRDKIALYLACKQLDGLSELTLNNYKLHLLRFASYVRKDIKEITVMDVRMYLAVLQKERKIKNTTLATEISMLKSFFGWLNDNEYIDRSPMRQIKQPKVDKRLRKSLDQEELELMRIACTSKRQRAILEMLFSTGCRVSEIVGVDISDIEWKDQSIKVIGKGNKERIVYFNDKAKVYLKEYLRERGIHEGNDALFIASKKPHNRMGKRSIEIEIRGIAQAAGFEKAVYPHLIRHTMATQALQAGVSLQAIQHLLGHTDPSTTQIYAETDETSVKEEYRKHMVQ